MDKPNNGGSAFPEIVSDELGGLIHINSIGGMSLRDWFAGLAMNADTDASWSEEELVLNSYKIADLMIKEKEKNG